MKFTNEHIQQLLIEKITGTINAADDLMIEQLLMADENMRNQWEGMQQELQQALASGFSVEGDAEKSWQQVAADIGVKRKAKVFVLKVIAAAAILATIITGTYLLNERENALIALPKLPPAGTSNRVMLTLDGGETIYLKNNGDSVSHLGAATVTTHETTLSYQYPRLGIEQWTTLSVPAVFDYKITLSDGSEVWLNSETTLRFPFSFSGKTREVYVTGEAYFNVAKNANQPFVVHANETAIKVLGTRFNVNTYDSSTIKTALVEGAVTTTTKNNLINLKPGFEAIYNSLHTGFKVESFDESEVLSWMKGVYYFHNTPLKDLAKILSRWYNVKVEFSNPSLEDKTFSGEIIKKQTIQFFLDNIKISNQVDTDLKNGVVKFR